MSETQEQPTGIVWGDPITPERLAELKEMFERQKVWAAKPNRNIYQSAFKGMCLTGADVFWLMALWNHKGDIAQFEPTKTSVEILRELPSILYLADPVRFLQEQDFMDPLKFLRDQGFPDEILQKSSTDSPIDRPQIQGADLSNARLEDAYLAETQLEGADLRGAHLKRSILSGASLVKANLLGAHLEGALLNGAEFSGADLRGATFDSTSRLNNAIFENARLDQVILSDTNLTVVNWETVRHLGDEIEARREYGARNKAGAYRAAARAYRSLSVALRNQGLGTDATRFHYRSELMERKSYFWQIFARLGSRRFYTAPAYFGRWLFSWLLGTFAGYGDYFGRLLLTYMIVVSAFAGLMFLASGRVVSFDAIRDVFVLSVTSFHGRGVQPPGLHLNDGLATLTAVEAFFGLLIEGIFIAAFTRRVTGN